MVIMLWLLDTIYRPPSCTLKLKRRFCTFSLFIPLFLLILIPLVYIDVYYTPLTTFWKNRNVRPPAKHLDASRDLSTTQPPTSINPELFKREFRTRIVRKVICPEADDILNDWSPQNYRNLTREDAQGNIQILTRPNWQRPHTTTYHPMRRTMHLWLAHCTSCHCDENGNLIEGPSYGYYDCHAETAEECQYWYSCYCITKEVRDEIFSPEELARFIAEANMQEEGGLPESQAGPSTHRERPRPRPAADEIGELSTDRREVDGTNERYEVEGPSRSRRGNWDWFRRSVTRFGRWWGVHVLDRTINRAHGGLRGSNPGKGKGKGKGPGFRKRVVNVSTERDANGLEARRRRARRSIKATFGRRADV
ncbi:hypothetical protein Dda_6259 [Drechslerella dactyloides]|uniref:Uncharacterized protein n=1 Tax=Drechslerella dactyloides TaxID=74499 RepID=A0AAD6NIB4_DREDA|nr:hypothetical protein Dda_6259 [Drechslerella dactyloides]